MDKQDSNEHMGSVGSHESLNWFMDGDDMDIGLNITGEDMGNSQVQQLNKKRSSAARRSTNDESDSQPSSDDNPSRNRVSRKKHSKKRDVSESSEVLPAHKGVLPGNDPAFNESFERSMKNSSSRLSRSLSAKGGSSVSSSVNPESYDSRTVNSTVGSYDPSSGDESETMRSEAAMAAEQKFKDKNREHARNTRSRKKQYIEMLKQAFNELSAEREKVDRERNEAIVKLAEQVITIHIMVTRRCFVLTYSTIYSGCSKEASSSNNVLLPCNW
jgi:hypothetical protein